jgi:hypothetical protein
VREIQCSTALNGYLKFPHVTQVFRIKRTTMKLDGTPLRNEMSYGVTSLLPDKAGPAKVLHLSRGHWAIENKLHWVRDVTFDEDRSQVRTKAAPRTMACLRNLAISLHRMINGAKNIAEALRHCSWNPCEALRMIGA